MAQPPTPEDLGPLLGASSSLDDAPPDDTAEAGNGAFEAAAMAAVGTRAKAQALRDAFDAWAEEKGIIGSSSDEPDEDDTAGLDDTSDDSAGGGY